MFPGTMPIFMFLSAYVIALFSFVGVVVWSVSRRREREAFYRSEALKKIAETQQPGANLALYFLREQEKLASRRRREGIKLGGLVLVAAGTGVLIFLRALITDAPVFLAGLIPFLIGCALLAYSFLIAPKE